MRDSTSSTSENGTGRDVRDRGRTSRTTFLDKSSDAVVECIEHRATALAFGESSNHTLQTGRIVEKSIHGGTKVTCNVEKIGLNAWFGDQPWDDES